MPTDINILADAVIHVLNAHTDWIDFESLCRAVLPEIGRKKLTDNLRDDVADLLFDGGFQSVVLRRATGNEDGEDEFMARWHFFEGARFLAQLTSFEQERHILIPGHRFVPFVRPGIYPADIELRYNGAALKTKTIELTIRETALYYSLVGRMGWFSYLSCENELDDIETLDTPATLTVFDLSPIFEDARDLQTLRMQCDNFTDGIISIVDVGNISGTVDFSAVHRGVEALDNALAAIFEEYGPDGLILPEQIAHAYARMPDWFFDQPPFHFGGYLELSKRVCIAETEFDSILWYVDRDPKEDSDPDLNETLASLRNAIQQSDDPAAIIEDILGDDAEDELPGLFDKALYKDDPSLGKRPAVQAGRTAETDKVYRLKVALDGNKGIHRIIDVHSETTWEELHAAIFNAFDRFDPHLYSFFFPDKPTSSERTRWNAPEIGCPEERGGPDDAQEVTIGEVGLRKGKTFYYLFDYGDSWWHEIRVESVEKTTSGISEFPRVVKRVGKSPKQYG